jgi:pyruvate, orthophosphate dikinase
VLNLGMTDATANIIANLTNLKFASDVYRRFLQMYGTVVLGVESQKYEEILAFARKKRGVDHDCQLEQDDLTSIVTEFKAITDVPQDPWKQLEKMIVTVFHSWNSPRAIAYRDANDISADLGVAVTIQAMVYGNYNDRSGCGFAYTRNPTTGENVICGRYLSNCEGEDVYCDIHRAVDLEEMRQNLPGCYDNLIHFEKTLERHYRDMLCLEFTIQNGALYILECTRAKRTAKAGVRIAVAMVYENLITERDAILRIDPELMHTFLYPIVDPNIGGSGIQGISTAIIGQGHPLSPGTIAGKIVLSYDQVQEVKKDNTEDNAIYVLEDQAHFDQRCLEAADAFVFCRGDLTFEISNVMSDSGKPAVSNSDMTVDKGKQMVSGGVGGKQSLKQGDTITVDGASGTIYLGAVPTVPAGQDEDYRVIMRWANKYKKLDVFASADSMDDVKVSYCAGL